MLEELRISNLALISEAKLEFGAGLTVLSGETGAGKTVLLSALKLAMGERADSDSIRMGAEEASVQARFYFDKAQKELIVNRSLNVSGRSKASINDDMLTIKNLSEQVGPHIDLHGQHDHQTLLKHKNHVLLLDAFIGDEASQTLEQYRTSKHSFEEARKKLERLKNEASVSADELSLLELSVAEIQRVNPLEREDEELEEILPELVHAEEIASAAEGAWSFLSGDGGAYDQISEALVRISRASRHMKALEESEERIKSLMVELEDVSSELKSVSLASEYDESKLDQIQSRLMQLDTLKKRFGPSLEAVIKRLHDMQQRLDEIENFDEALSSAEVELESAKAQVLKDAEVLTDLRKSYAPAFIEKLKSSVADLALGTAQFDIEFRSLDFEKMTSLGASELEILYSSSSFSSLRPLAKIASGGELSRVMLGLKSIFGEKDTAEILVFDEIDAGIGGATALSVGSKLAELAKTHQVLVVTHLAQVAAFANHHFVVRRSENETGTDTKVLPLKGQERIEEIARMLSGNTGAAAMEHACELLESAK